MRVPTPDLHMAATIRPVVDPLTIRGKLRYIASKYQESFLASCDRNRVSIEVVICQAGKGDGLAVRRPTMEIRGAFRGHSPGRSTRYRHHVDAAHTIRILIPDSDQAAIG